MGETKQVDCSNNLVGMVGGNAGQDQYARLEALRLAQMGTEPVERTIERATAFYAFLTGSADAS